MPVADCDEINLKVFTPSIRGFFIKGEKVNMKILCVRLVFQLITLGRARIYYIQDGSDIVHTSYVVPSCVKFPFMNKQDFEIGPCYTYPEFRGRGIYPKVLRNICRKMGQGDGTFYMIVDEKNLSSIKGIEKAGFERCGFVKKSKIIKRYDLV